MKSIGEAIAAFRAAGFELERTSVAYSFGTRDECEALFYEALLACDKTITDLKKIPEHDEIIDWMVYTGGKGLALVGDCGRGKTSILAGVIPVIFKMQYNKLFIPYSAIELNKQPIKMVTIVDDIGIEGVKNDWGEKSQAFSDLMSDAESKVRPIFFSTNLCGTQIIERYGKRTMDRICRLCKIVKFKGESFRD